MTNRDPVTTTEIAWAFVGFIGLIVMIFAGLYIGVRMG